MSTTGRPMTVARLRAVLDTLHDDDRITDADGIPLMDAIDNGVLELHFAPRRHRTVRNIVHASGPVSGVMQVGGDLYGDLRM
ncbi:hypothetical protein [Nocardiopsis changdeensis]|uniref:hypothetical protein n=1 Tax=Nocardiopsis changdeensis TaxID=2831969 RepID=UPI003F4639EB